MRRRVQFHRWRTSRVEVMTRVERLCIMWLSVGRSQEKKSYGEDEDERLARSRHNNVQGRQREREKRGGIVSVGKATIVYVMGDQ